MTWDEITKNYERDVKAKKLEARRPKLEKNWDDLVKSTDKLVLLFSYSSGVKPQPKR